ncbi:MAG: right-handed parallel beta-helix repeat-containing protein [Myxococcales bacterium]|nr:right-handed parallel beta-helix repeat-containing protein [Myxococcales bacterium]
MLSVLTSAAFVCVSPLSHGAVPDDGKGDEVALQRTIAAAVAQRAAVCLPAGVFELGRAAGLASLVIDRGPVTLRGAGPTTILRMTGDGRRGDWRGLELRAGAHDVVLEDLTIDSLGTFNTEEQTHLVQVSPGARKITFRRLQLGPMRRADQAVGHGSGGDCLRLLGEAAQPVEDVVIAGSSFVDCDRSGVSLQRGLRRITISRCRFRGTGDSPVDFEPTAPGPIEDVSLVELDIVRPAKAQGAWAVTIGGHGDDVATRITMTGCTLRGGGVGMLNVGEVSIEGNDIEHGEGAAPTISVRRRAGRVRLIGNVITRPASAPAGALIEAQHNNGQSPTALVIAKNELRQGTSAAVISTISLAELEVSDNRIEYTGADARQFVIDTHAVLADAGKIRVLDNTIRGVAAAVLRLDARERAVTGVELRGNVGEDLRESVTCEAQAKGRIAEVSASDNALGQARSRCATAAP